MPLVPLPRFRIRPNAIIDNTLPKWLVPGRWYTGIESKTDQEWMVVLFENPPDGRRHAVPFAWVDRGT
jgi:hypothetical protein